MQVRRDKGLCYYCDDKFSFQHRCPNKKSFLLQLDDISPDDPDPKPPDNVPIDAAMPTPDHHSSLNAMKGSNGVGTLRFYGQIVGLPVQILVDGDSSDSFIQSWIAHFLRLPIEPAPAFQVLVGNEQTMVVEAKIFALKVTIQGHELTVPVYLLHVVGTDVILGSNWLATLGPHVADYATLSLKFFLVGKFITLQGP